MRVHIPQTGKGVVNGVATTRFATLCERVLVGYTTKGTTRGVGSRFRTRKVTVVHCQLRSLSTYNAQGTIFHQRRSTMFVGVGEVGVIVVIIFYRQLVPLGVTGSVFPTGQLWVLYRMVNVFGGLPFVSHDTRTVPTIPPRKNYFYKLFVRGAAPFQVGVWRNGGAVGDFLPRRGRYGANRGVHKVLF